MTDKSQLCGILFIVALCGVAMASPTYHRPSPPYNRICYRDIGCFNTSAPFNNSDGLLPQSPGAINTTFRLFTRTCHVQRVVSVDTAAVFEECGFDPARDVRVIVHGFLQHGQVSWITNMAAQLLVKDEMNVITVDWGSGSGFPYSQAAANTRVVGAEVARMISFLQSRLGTSAAKVHVIGHSLGAHIAGYAGNTIQDQSNDQLARITGLDPAEPDFRDTESIVHLDKNDAAFVDIMHTDDSEFDYVSGFGWMAEVGHVDFYPNAGEYQPGCPSESVSNIVSAAYYHGFNDAEDVLSCSHGRAYYLFTESINSPCPFFGHPCQSLADLDSNRGNCLRCSGGVCPQMGFHADRTHARGKFYLRTRGSSPYCGFAQHVEVQLGAMERTTGEIKLELVGNDQTSDALIIRSGNRSFISGGRREVMFVDRERLDQVTEVRVGFRENSNSWFWSRSSLNSLVVYKVSVTAAEDGRTIHFCGDHAHLTSGNTITLRRSSTDPNECQLAPFSDDTFNVNQQ